MTKTTVLVVGAGPGGLAVADSLQELHLETLVLEKGVVGQAWLQYPSDTHLLSESSETPTHHDENMIAGVPTSEVFANMPHPSHLIYQKYLEHVANKKTLPIVSNQEVQKVIYHPDTKSFFLTTKSGDEFQADFLVWAAGMYSTPNDDLDCPGDYIHYANMPYLDEVSDDVVTVVGSANGASSVVMQLAKPARLIHLVVSKEYVVPQPIDCLWKEQMVFIQDLVKQGLVKLTEHFRVQRIYEDVPSKQFVLESDDGKQLFSPTKPIVCTGFLPNVGPIADLVDVIHQDHDALLAIDEDHQSKKTPHLYVAGCVGKLEHDKGFIRHFRDFGTVIAESIAAQAE